MDTPTLRSTGRGTMVSPMMHAQVAELHERIEHLVWTIEGARKELREVVAELFRRRST